MTDHLWTGYAGHALSLHSLSGIGNLKSTHICSCCPTWLQTGSFIPWITEMDLPSLYLQQDWAMSFIEGVAGWDFTLFRIRHLDLYPVTLMYELCLDIGKMHLHTKVNFLGQGFQKLLHYRHRYTQTDATKCIIALHSWTVISAYTVLLPSTNAVR